MSKTDAFDGKLMPGLVRQMKLLVANDSRFTQAQFLAVTGHTRPMLQKLVKGKLVQRLQGKDQGKKPQLYHLTAKFFREYP